MTEQYLNKYKLYFLPVFCLVLILSCNKKEFLDEPPFSDLFIPKSLVDFRALLDNDEVMRETPMMGEVSADNFYISNSFYLNLNSRERNCYVWNKDIYFPSEKSVEDWDIPYQQVFYANVVLDGLEKIRSNKGGDAVEFDAVMGTALFLRAYAFHNLAQVFCPPYDPNISEEDNKFGLPLRTKPGIGLEPRSTVLATYSRILKDLDSCIDKLPAVVNANPLNRPTKASAYALVARVYLSMRNYEAALLNANRCLEIYDSLINYESISTTSNTPFSKDNGETIYQSILLSSGNVLRSVTGSPLYVDSNLYKSYSTDDLRRAIFYTPNPAFPSPKRGYTGLLFMFSGLATDEVYLIKAECLARTGNYTQAMNVLNQLLVTRYKSGTFVPIVAANAQEALDTILAERRKELPFRGLRWSDLRRLNLEGRNIIVNRFVNGENYELLPKSNRYVLPIPENVKVLGQVEQYERN
jgi:starch-binding outer membrane protein, SusD/RagB family